MSIVSDGRSPLLAPFGASHSLPHTKGYRKASFLPIWYALIAHLANFSIGIIAISFEILTHEHAPFPE
jgi:hypothetical protein